ncbi:glutamate receptor ionotropic, delta-1-like [Rhipicephalus microplus]|uniref:glutamate receptor ionotropic, delta-1-like n=1 Tax=Rhipicephalus microplus TaxID=6941 RepID=UPI003F6D5895
MGNQSSICSQCGIIQNHHGLEWYTTVAGLRLKVGAVHNAPHWRLTRIPKHHGTDSRGGIEQAYVIALSRHFNFTYDVIEAGGSKFGGLDGDTWSGMVGQIHRKEVDIAVGGLSVFYFRFLFVDFVYPYITDVFAFVSKAPTRLPLTQTIIYPFQQQVWMALFASLLVAWAGVIVLRRWTPRDKLVGDAPDIWLLFATLVRQSDWGSEFRTLSFRCLLAAWLLLSLVASNSYSCLLLSFMSVPAFSPHVDTPERLQEAILAGKYTAGTSNGTAQYTLIMETREGPLAAVRSCMVRDSNDLVPNKQVGLDRAVSHNYAYIDTQRGLSAALLERHNTSIEVSTGHIGTTIMSLAMHKTCFYRNAFSTISRRLVESGHFLKWEREDQPAQPKLKQSQFKTIEISDVFSHGTILIAGYGLALVALVGEYARFRYVSRRRLGQYQQRPTDSPVKAIASLRPRRAKKAQRRQSIKRSSSTVAIAVPTPLPPLLPPNRPTRWETRVVGQSGFKRVSINLGPNAFPKIDSTAGQLPLEASGAGSQPRRDDRRVLPNFLTVST